MHCSKLLIANFDSGRVRSVVEFGVDLEPLLRCGVGDQVDNDFVANQRTTSPVLRNVAEHAMFDFVPLTGAWRKVTHVDRHLQNIGQVLQCYFPQTTTATVAPATVSSNQQLLRATMAA